MGFAKLSVTIPDETYDEIKSLAAKKHVKLSHLVAEALAEKAQRIKEDEFIQQVNNIFEDPDVAKEQTEMANMIADSTELEELPW
jgi:hypothetical protein